MLLPSMYLRSLCVTSFRLLGPPGGIRKKMGVELKERPVILQCWQAELRLEGCRRRPLGGVAVLLATRAGKRERIE